MNYASRVGLVFLSALVSLTGSFFLFYGGRYEPPSLPIPGEEAIVPAAFPSQPFTESPQKRKGTLLVDMTHFNNYDDKDLNILLSRVSARGYIIQLLGNVNEWMDTVAKRAKREEDLEVALRSADSYLVALPWYGFSNRERELVRKFVDRGGKLLMIADATKSHMLNPLAADYGLIFETDYLYNVVEHETNFQNFFVRSFKPGKLTQGLKTVVFYSAGSISPESQGLLFTDENTYSSSRERHGPFNTLALNSNGRVLALADLTFMMPPYNSVMDNDLFISNIADFLTTSERAFGLAEFPFFLGEEIDVIAGNEGLVPSAQSLRNILSTFEKTAEVKERENFLRETAFLGLWQDSSKVEHYLISAGLRVGQKIQTPFTSDISAEGAALLYLHQSQGRNMLVLLGENKEIVEEVMDRLRTGEFRQGLVSDKLGLYRIEKETSSSPGRTPSSPGKRR